MYMCACDCAYVCVSVHVCVLKINKIPYPR